MLKAWLPGSSAQAQGLTTHTRTFANRAQKGLNQTLCIAGETHNCGLHHKDKTKASCYDADHKTGFDDSSPGTCSLCFLCCHFTACCQTSWLLLATQFHLVITPFQQVLWHSNPFTKSGIEHFHRRTFLLGRSFWHPLSFAVVLSIQCTLPQVSTSIILD